MPTITTTARHRLGSLRVVHADDHEYLSFLMARDQSRTGIEFAALVASVSEAVEAALILEPDAVILDLHLPLTPADHATRCVDPRGGLQATEQLRQRGFEGAILLLSGFLDLYSAIQLLTTGGPRVGVMDKRDLGHSSFRPILDCIVGGAPHMEPVVRSSLREWLTLGRHIDKLSKRNLDVLRLLANGKANAQIAEELFISERTVESHVAHIFRELGLPPDEQIQRRVIAALMYIRYFGWGAFDGWE